MKLPKVQELINNWPKSLPFLKESVLRYFQKNDIPVDNVWFADIEILLPVRLMDKENIQVVFFGGFLERFLESGNWARKNYSFWVLSERVKEVMTALLHFSPSSVSVIPRYEFISKSNEEKLFDLDRPLQLVYPGRLTPQKNIEMVLAFTSLLQEKIKTDVQLTLLGDWEDQPPKRRGRFKIESFRHEVEAFQQHLHFTVNPVVDSSYGPAEWTHAVSSNSLLVNFSTYVHEDFGLAIAEAQKIGMPMLLSKWGGHCDVRGKNVHWVDAQFIGESLTSAENILLKAQVVVEKFLNGVLEKADLPLVPSLNVRPEFLSLEQLNNMRLQSMEVHGYGLALIAQGWMTLFADTEEGREFFKKYNMIFRGGAK